MARKTDILLVADESSRDHGKAYHITEMSASQGEAWGLRAMLALTRSGIEVPPEVLSQGLMGVAILGIKAFAGITWPEAQPLLAEMMACVQFCYDPNNPSMMRTLTEPDIEEVSTRLLLRERVLSLHLGFSIAAKLSTYRLLFAAKTQESNTSSPTTEISPNSSEGSSEVAALPSTN